ncbi:hypothetical protein [Kordia sp.]|uniref:hypothetical protein n=1 Tax=Kordia sp. TaxID=1965332 RepID=UPI003D6B18E8
MKKQIKKLALSKKVVANFNDLQGGRPPKTHGQTCGLLTCGDCFPTEQANCHDTIVVSLVVVAPCNN